MRRDGAVAGGGPFDAPGRRQYVYTTTDRHAQEIVLPESELVELPQPPASASVFQVRATAKGRVLPEKQVHQPWRNGLRRKYVEQRAEDLIELTSAEWRPYPNPTAPPKGEYSKTAKLESILKAFKFPTENEKDE